MATSASVTSSNPLQVTLVTDASIVEIKGDLSFVVGNDTFNLPVDQVNEVNPVQQSDSSGHVWSVVSDDKKPVRTIIYQY